MESQQCAAWLTSALTFGQRGLLECLSLAYASISVNLPVFYTDICLVISFLPNK